MFPRSPECRVLREFVGPRLVTFGQAGTGLGPDPVPDYLLGEAEPNGTG